LRTQGNRRLRGVLMQTADNLVQCNAHYRALSAVWRHAGKDPRWIRVKVAKRFTRLAFAMVSGGQLFPHPCCQKRHYILQKLLNFCAEHDTPLPQRQQALPTMVERLPRSAYVAEAASLQEELDALSRRRGPQPLGDVINLVLARLTGTVVQSTPESARP
jgi:hypothetical protein